MKNHSLQLLVVYGILQHWYYSTYATSNQSFPSFLTMSEYPIAGEMCYYTIVAVALLNLPDGIFQFVAL